jgi:hypothetical protein
MAPHDGVQWRDTPEAFCKLIERLLHSNLPDLHVCPAGSLQTWFGRFPRISESEAISCVSGHRRAHRPFPRDCGAREGCDVPDRTPADRAPESLVRLAHKLGVALRQSYALVSKLTLIRHQRYAHKNQLKRANRSLLA